MSLYFCRHIDHSSRPLKDRTLKRSGYTIFEVLAAAFVMTATLVAWRSISAKFGPGWGIGAAFCAGAVSLFAVVLFYRRMWQLDARDLQQARDKYHDIYRIVAIPTHPTVIVMAEGAEIRVADYAWEAGPSRDDGLIYLQGLTLDWTVVWHVGLPADNIQRVGTKPHSQYDSWYPDWADPPALPPCPFPVVERKTMTVGRPHFSHRYFVLPAAYLPDAVLNGNDSETF